MTELVPGAILLGTYVVLAIGQPPLPRIDRTGAVIIGAILKVTSRVKPGRICRQIDWGS
jgi:hypothetical protein